uniref:Peroxidase n=1 Tax=Macrostomum lignano TaxID=282301 RepID=A0A1I8F7Z8_9PLAT
WGQFLDHDLDFTPVDPAAIPLSSTDAGGNETCTNEAPCFPIPVYSTIQESGTDACIGSSAPAPHHRLHRRLKRLRSTENEARDVARIGLRSGLPARGPADQPVEPASAARSAPASPVDCQIDPRKRHIPCFLAAETHRANEQLGLTAVHTLWMREHKQTRLGVCAAQPSLVWRSDILRKLRKIHLTFSHWLPVILGTSRMRQLGRYRGYNMSVERFNSQVFAHSGYAAFFAPHRLVGEGGIDPILRGLVGRGAKQVNPQIRRAFGERCAWCIGHPNNVDLFAGLVAEDAVDGSLVGPTTLCLLLVDADAPAGRDGDRFWYESPDQFSHCSWPRSGAQPSQGHLRANADNVTAIQPDVFSPARTGKSAAACSRLDPGLNLKFWKECPAIDGQQC